MQKKEQVKIKMTKRTLFLIHCLLSAKSLRLPKFVEKFYQSAAFHPGYGSVKQSVYKNRELVYKPHIPAADKILYQKVLCASFLKAFAGKAQEVCL